MFLSCYAMTFQGFKPKCKQICNIKQLFIVLRHPVAHLSAATNLFPNFNFSAIGHFVDTDRDGGDAAMGWGMRNG